VKDRLRADLLRAMKAKDETTLKVLRSALAAIANAEAIDPKSAPAGATEVERRLLTDADMRAVIQAELDEMAAAAVDLRANDRPDDASALDRRRSILDGYV
jgi:uncharacterized protein YqeY